MQSSDSRSDATSQGAKATASATTSMQGGKRAEDLAAIPLPRAFRLLGYALCALVSFPEVTGFIDHGTSDHGAYWCVAYATFCLAYHAFATAGVDDRGAKRRWLALGIEAAALVLMGLAAPCEFAAVAFVVVALEASLILPPKVILPTLTVFTACMSALVMRGCGAQASAGWLLAMTGFEAAVSAAVVLARRESQARVELAQTNVELRAARTLLAESARAAERHRIARDLHDSLGHKLTALGLHLEVAKNVAEEKRAAHVANASTLSDEALADLRAAVGAMRTADGPDVGRAIRKLCLDTPGITCHLDLPQPLFIDDADRAHCVVRCVQEVLTNTMRHSGAENIWIRVEQNGSTLELSARDDGHGAPNLRSGNGLSGMRERVEALGGRLVVAATPAFSLLAELPADGGAA